MLEPSFSIFIWNLLDHLKPHKDGNNSNLSFGPFFTQTPEDMLGVDFEINNHALKICKVDLHYKALMLENSNYILLILIFYS